MTSTPRIPERDLVTVPMWSSQMRAAAPPPPPPPALPPGTRGLGAGLLALAALLATVSVLGPLVLGIIDWRISGLVHNQLLGLDAVSLAIVAPLAAVAGVLCLRDRPIGPVLGVGPAAYAAYMVPQYVLGPDYLHVAGNNELAFPLMLALFVAGVVCAVMAWVAIEPAGLGASPARERLVGRVLLPLAAVCVFGRYLVALPDVMSATPTAQDYLAGPTFFWTIALLDLGLSVPAIVATCVGLRRGAAWAPRALYAVTAWLALVGTAVAGMAVAMLLRDDPTMTAGGATAMVILAGALVAIAGVLFAPLLRRSRPS